MTEPATAARPTASADGSANELLSAFAVALVVGGGLAAAARGGTLALLIAVAVLQALVGVSWIVGTALPGRIGAFLILAAASAGADVTVSVWPHGRLGTLLAVFGLAVPVMFVHQLARSAARVRVAESLGAIAFGVLVVVAPAALIQLRHEFASASVGGKVVAGVVAAAAAALVVGCLVDLVFPAPRFDPTVPRGLLAVIVAAGLGAAVGQLSLDSGTGFLNGRGAFVGAAVGVLAAFFAIAVAFAQRSAPAPSGRWARRLRPGLGALVPLALFGPVAFLLCLAVRA